MHILSFSIQHLKQWRARKKQTRTALQLLASAFITEYARLTGSARKVNGLEGPYPLKG